MNNDESGISDSGTQIKYAIFGLFCPTLSCCLSQFFLMSTEGLLRGDIWTGKITKKARHALWLKKKELELGRWLLIFIFMGKEK